MNDYVNKKNPVWELMIPIFWNDLKIRVWWTDDRAITTESVKSLLSGCLYSWKDPSQDPKTVAAMLAKFSDNVAAVEVLNYGNQGVVYYPDWK